MATYTDAFGRGDENPLAAPWVIVSANMPQLASGAVWGVTISVYHVARIPTATTGIGQTNHYAQAKVAAAPNAAGERFLQVCVRCSAAANTYYAFRSDSGSSVIFKMVAGTPTNITTGGAAFALNNVVRLEVSGTSLTAKIDGATTLTGTDADIATGDPGFGIHSNNTPRLDDFEAGDIATAGRGAQVFQHFARIRTAMQHRKWYWQGGLCLPEPAFSL
jgi:hypothetical protein